MPPKKWKQAATIESVRNQAKTAATATIDKARITDLRVSQVEGTDYSSTEASVIGSGYNSSLYAGLTISAETIKYKGGAELKDYTTDDGKTIEQFIQPMSFYNNFKDESSRPRGVIAHVAQKNQNNADDTLNVSGFGVFAAPNENVILTVAEENDGGIYNYLEGDKISQIATGKTGIVIDASNRVFMGINGESLKQGGLDFLVKGSKKAQLYVKGDIVVDGSGVQIEKYLVDDIFVGSSAAIMGNGLADPSDTSVPDPYPYKNDIGVSVPNLALELEAKELANSNAGYLFVGNDSYFYGDISLAGGASIGSGNTLENSGNWINGYSTLNISAPSYGSQSNQLGVSFKAINSNIFDYEDDNALSSFQHARFDYKDSALLLHHSNPLTSQGSLIFLRTRGTSGETLDTDVTGQIQFRGYKNGSQRSTGKLTSTGAGNITMYAPNNITIDGSSSVILKTNVTDSAGTTTTNNITFESNTAGNTTAALATIHPDSSITTESYNSLLDVNDWAIPNVAYVKTKGFWKEYDSATATLNDVANPTINNIYVPNNMSCDGNVQCNTLSCNTLSVPEHFVTVCVEVTTITYPWYYFGFIGEEHTTMDCVTVAEPNTTNVQLTDFSSNIFVHGVASMLYSSQSDPTLTDGGLAIFPQEGGSAGMSLISHRLQSSDAATATIFFGDALGTQSSLMTDTNIGAIQSEIGANQTIGNMLFYGTDSNADLKTFMKYTGGSSSSTEINRVSGTGPVLMINDFTDVPSNSFQNTNQTSVAKLTLQRSNGETPSTNKTGIIGEIDFNGYANGNGLGTSLTTAVSIQCWNAGDSQASQSSQGQNGFLAINIYDNDGNPGGHINPAIQIDSTNHVYINGIPAGIGIQNSDRAWLGNPWYGAGFNGFDIFPDSTYTSLNPAFSVFSSTTDGSGNGSIINNGLVAAAGGYITGTYLLDSAADYYMTDVSFVRNHVSQNGSNWEILSNSTTLAPKGSGSTVTVVEAQSFNATSDVAKKENIQTISGALESIDELRGVTYNLKADESKKTHHGVVAQEIEKIFPDMVAGEEGNKSVSYMEIIGVLVEAVKDLKKRVEELENK